MWAEFGDGHVVRIGVYFVAAKMEEGGVVRGAGQEVVKESGDEICDGGVV